jgi:regulator of sigma E protease
LDALIVVASFALVLGVIIFVHEGGHYLVAKAFDTRVLTFSLGFGPRIFGFQRGETEYRVSWVPLGGYVRLGGESPEEATGDPRDFQSKPRWQRILVYLAGPAMNVLLAILLIAVVLVLGQGLPFMHQIPPVVGAVEPGSPAQAAGLQPGDEIVAAKGRPVEDWEAVAMAILESPGKPVPLVIERGGSRLELVVVPITVPRYELGDAGMFPKVLSRISTVTAGSPADRAGLRVGDELRAVDGRPLASDQDFVRYIESHAGQTVVISVLRAGALVEVPVMPLDDGSGTGKIGVGRTIAQKLPIGPALVESARYNWNITKQTIALIGKLLRREMKVRSAVHGPLEIASLSGQAAKEGLPSLMHLMGLVSISIAILNLLPIPVLDGGQILVLLVESLLRRDLSLRLKEAINLVGLAFIVLLMVTVIFFDVRRRWFPAEVPAPAATPAPTPAPGAPPIATPLPATPLPASPG